MDIRILLADDHQIILDGLCAILAQQPEIEVIAMVHDGREAVRKSCIQRPHVVIMDLAMPGLNGIEAIHQIITECPGVKSLCLSMHADKRFVAAALKAGASGYMLKDQAADDLIRAIHTVMANQVFLSPVIAGIVVESYTMLQSATLSPVFTLLTQREREVLQLIAEGCDTKSIATQLRLSLKTIATHREHLMDKLHIYSIAGLTKYAIREGLTTTE
jgi:DNA-binding NarL/FixJ family response regulator